MKLTLLAASAILSTAFAQSPLYKDPKAPIDDRVADLLKRMTIEEKTSQLLQGDLRNWLDWQTNKYNATGLKWSTEKRGGSYYVGIAMDPQWINEGVKKAQLYAVENTTLGIPPWVQTEGIHGLLAVNATIFNSPIAHACSFNPELIRKMAAAIARESKAIGVNQILGPLADLARELRFGRVEETLGEDPYLAGELAYEYVKGLQGGGVSAMVKHFTAFATPEQGLNCGPVHGGERELRTTYLPPFHRAIIDAEATAIMTSYNSYDGVAVIASHFLLTEILRDEWKYEYFTMSDAGATDRVCAAFKMCEEKPIDKVAVTNYVLPAGNDVEMGGGSYNFEVIPQLVKAGKLDIKIVDTAVARMLKAKFKMGLFEKPYLGSPASAASRHIHIPEHVALARQLDAESIVLLENHNNILPLKKSANIALIGPMAHGYINYGDYVVWNSSQRGVSPYDGLKNASTGKVTFSQGCERWSPDQSGFPAAVAAAEAADVAVVVVGTWSRDQNELWMGLNATTGEHVDGATLNLVGAMPHLVKAIIDTGKPTIVVYSSGKPITEPWISKAASALVQQFYPSEEGGNALADILYGDINPSGKLSVGFPYDVGTTPIYYDYLNSGRFVAPGEIYENGTMKFGHQYVLHDSRPQYEFGYGKSYTTFKYGPLTLSKSKVAAHDRIQATVQVTNNGTRDGAEVVQLYVKDLITSVVVPNMALKGFKKVEIKAGATETIKFDLKVKDFGLWDYKMQYVVEPGKFVLYAASSSAQLRSNATLEVM